MRKIGKDKINKYERSKNETSKYGYLATFRKSYQCCNIKSENVILGL